MNIWDLPIAGEFDHGRYAEALLAVAQKWVAYNRPTATRPPERVTRDAPVSNSAAQQCGIAQGAPVRAACTRRGETPASQS